MVSVCCFKLRGFGVICNDAVDNQYHRHFCSLLCSDQKSELQGVLAGTWLKQRCPGWSTHLRKKSTCQVPSGDGTRNGSGALVAELRDPFPPAPPVVGSCPVGMAAGPVGSRVGKLLQKELLGHQQWIQAGQAPSLFVHSFSDNQAPTVC